MTAALSAAALVYLACLAVGAAALRACRRPALEGYAAAVGLAVLIVAASLAIKLPGDALTAAVLLCLVVLGSAVYARRELLRLPPTEVVLATLLLALALTVPFLAAGEVGIPGVGINYDMSVHVPWADTLREEGIDKPLALTAGYPLGPHALVATLAEGLGIDSARAFIGFLLALPLLALLSALSLFEKLDARRRAGAALLVALPYLMAAYYGQAAFKEIAQATFLVAFLALLRGLVLERALDVRRLALMAVLLVGAFYNYSYLGVSWMLAAVAVWLPLELTLGGGWLRPVAATRQAFAALTGSRRNVVLALGASAAVTAALLPELSRAVDFFRQVSFSPSGTGSITTTSFGNLSEALSPFSALGIWPNENFRDYFDTPRDAYKAGLAGAVAVLGLLVGGAWWLRRRDLVLPAAALAAAAIYLYLKPNESPYVSAKALVLLSPLAMAVALGGLLVRRDDLDRELRIFRTALAAAFVGLSLLSSFLALRGSWVGPVDHERELDSIRPIVRGATVLFMPADFFANWELRGARVSGTLIPQPVQIVPRPGKGSGEGRALDFDSVTNLNLDQFDYAVSPRTSYRSEPPANFHLVKTTRSYELWKRAGLTPARKVLAAEGHDPGAVLDCSTASGRRLSRRTGWARVREKPAVATGPPDRRVKRGMRESLSPGDAATRSLALDRGRYELSLVFTAPRSPEIELPPMPRPAAQLQLAGPFWRVGEIDWPGGRLTMRVRAAEMKLGASTQVTDVGELAGVRIDRKPALVPLRQACGRYVDWYTVGPARPPLPPSRD